jgi:hypothetical protein
MTSFVSVCLSPLPIKKLCGFHYQAVRIHYIFLIKVCGLGWRCGSSDKSACPANAKPSVQTPVPPIKRIEKVCGFTTHFLNDVI